MSDDGMLGALAKGALSGSSSDLSRSGLTAAPQTVTWRFALRGKTLLASR
jgi:hypothetical protein